MSFGSGSPIGVRQPLEVGEEYHDFQGQETWVATGLSIATWERASSGGGGAGRLQASYDAGPLDDTAGTIVTSLGGGPFTVDMLRLGAAGPLIDASAGAVRARTNNNGGYTGLVGSPLMVEEDNWFQRVQSQHVLLNDGSPADATTRFTFTSITDHGVTLGRFAGTGSTLKVLSGGQNDTAKVATKTFGIGADDNDTLLTRAGSGIAAFYRDLVGGRATVRAYGTVDNPEAPTNAEWIQMGVIDEFGTHYGVVTTGASGTGQNLGLDLRRVRALSALTVGFFQGQFGTGVATWSEAGFGFGPVGIGFGPAAQTQDVRLARQGAAGILGLYRDDQGNPAEFRVYNKTDALAGAPTNAEWIAFNWDTNIAYLRTGASGTGVNRPFILDCGGSLTLVSDTSKIQLSTDGGYIVPINYQGIVLNKDAIYGLSSHATNPNSGTTDTRLSRAAAGVWSLDTTTTGDALALLKMGGAVGAGTLAPTWTNFPGVLAGAQNPYTWLKFVATDGTAVYVAAFK